MNIRAAVTIGSTETYIVYPWTSISTGWHQLAVCKDSSGLRMYLDGTRVVEDVSLTADIDTNINVISLFNPNTQLINMPIDELRISDAALYTGASYVPETGELSVLGSTISLYHMNEGTGTTMFDSGSGEDMELYGTFDIVADEGWK